MAMKIDFGYSRARRSVSRSAGFSERCSRPPAPSDEHDGGPAERSGGQQGLQDARELAPHLRAQGVFVDLYRVVRQDDCRATLALRDWLEERRAELAGRLSKALLHDPPSPVRLGRLFRMCFARQ